MTGNEKGMDVDAIRAVAYQLDQRKAALDALSRQVSSLVSQAQAHWGDGGAQRFKREWNSVHRPKLNGLSLRLGELAAKARKNADAQEQTSAVLDGSSGPGPGMAGGALTMSVEDLVATGGVSVANPKPPKHREMLELADVVESKNPSLPPGWSVVSDQELRRAGVDPSLLVDRKTGFAARVFVDNKGQYVLGFAGTNPTDAADLKADLDSLYGVPKQHRQAVTLALAVSAAADKKGVPLTITGHSLGGGLAQASSIATGRQAVIFNSAGISNATISMAYRRSEDTLSEVFHTMTDSSASVLPSGAAFQSLRNEVENRRLGRDQIVSYEGSWDALGLANEYAIVVNPHSPLGKRVHLDTRADFNVIENHMINRLRTAKVGGFLDDE